jgi:hypothetical protein
MSVRVAASRLPITAVINNLLKLGFADDRPRADFHSALAGNSISSRARYDLFGTSPATQRLSEFVQSTNDIWRFQGTPGKTASHAKGERILEETTLLNNAIASFALRRLASARPALCRNVNFILREP